MRVKGQCLSASCWTGLLESEAVRSLRKRGRSVGLLAFEGFEDLLSLCHANEFYSNRVLRAVQPNPEYSDTEPPPCCNQRPNNDDQSCHEAKVVWKDGQRQPLSRRKPPYQETAYCSEDCEGQRRD